MDKYDLISNIGRIHSTELGIKRISNNLGLCNEDVIEWCRKKILNEKAYIEKKGKNWYVHVDGCIITVNAGSYTLITAHKEN